MIREATSTDAEAMEQIMIGEAPLITLNPDGSGAELVLASMKADVISANIVSGRFVYWVATGNESDQILQGLIGLRDGSHLYQLFVASPHHRQGVGRSLWNHMLEHWPARWPRPDHLTVNASPYGLPAYEAFGFTPTGPRKEMNGIAFIPMRCLIH